MYYIEKEEKIVLFDNDLVRLQNTLKFMPQYAGLEIKETKRPISDFEWADTPKYVAKELEKQKKEKISKNDKLRDEALNRGVLYKDVLFDSDTDQKVNLIAIVSTLSDEEITVWFGKDNAPLECTKEDLLAIGALITALHTFCWTKNAEIKGKIEEAKTLEELEEVEINYSLPDSNGGENENTEVTEGV